MALPHTPPAISNAFSEYDWVVVYLFRALTRSYTPSTLPHVLPFTLDDVRDAATQALQDGVISKSIKNIPDIKYVYDARRDFPQELMQVFPITWLPTGKGRYVFRKTRRKNIIDLNAIVSPPPAIEYVIDQAPSFTSSLMGTDEQAVFARVRYAGLINQMLGFQATPVQGHHRTSVGYGQVEVDEVLAGLQGQTGVIVPISGKGGQDNISWSQVLNLNTYGLHCLGRYRVDPPMTGVAVRSLCLWLDKVTNEIWIVEFTPHHHDIDAIDVVQVRRFIFIK